MHTVSIERERVVISGRLILLYVIVDMLSVLANHNFGPLNIGLLHAPVLFKFILHT
jgi:hypothetical protein